MEDRASPPPAPASSHRVRLVLAVTVGLLVVGGILGWFLSRKGTAGSQPSDRRPRPAAAARIVVEAESGTALAEPLKPAADDQASGRMGLTIPARSCVDGQHLHMTEDPAGPKRTAGSVQVPFKVETAGEYVLWIRKWWCCAEGDAFVVELDGGRSYIFGDDGANYRQWSWLDLREGGRPVRFKLASGKHTLLIRSRGESDFLIDQLLFTTDAGLRPKGIEKP